jgi:hypothetical protein
VTEVIRCPRHLVKMEKKILADLSTKPTELLWAWVCRKCNDEEMPKKEEKK